MGMILSALYDGNLLIEPVIEKRSPEYQKACHTAYRLLEELERKLNDEEKEMLNKATDALSDENYFYASERFARGYCLGALTMLEIMEKREELILRQEE